MEGLKFLNNPQSYNPDGVFVAHLSGINNKNELFKQLSKKLLFPDYFGLNWDALLDMLCDFNWIEQQRIVLVHDDLLVLDKKELHIYLGILFDAIKSWQDWKEDEKHSLEVVFSKNVKDLIQKPTPKI
jgi:RNAse (barnase) inhibitor barstar